MTPRLVIAVALLIALAVIGGHASRAIYGQFYGTLVLLFVCASCACFAAAYRLHRRGQSATARELRLFATACSLAFLGWLLHPEQTVILAESRLSEAEAAIDDFRLEQQFGQRTPDAGVRFNRLAIERRDRHADYQAALRAAESKATIHPSTLLAYACWAATVVAGLLAVRAFQSRRNAAREP